MLSGGLRQDEAGPHYRDVSPARGRVTVAAERSRIALQNDPSTVYRD